MTDLNKSNRLPSNITVAGGAFGLDMTHVLTRTSLVMGRGAALTTKNLPATDCLWSRREDTVECLLVGNV